MGLFTPIHLKSSHYASASAFASVLVLPTHPSPMVSIWSVCDGDWVDAPPRVVMVYMHYTWLQFMVPPATQAPPPKLIFVDDF